LAGATTGAAALAGTAGIAYFGYIFFDGAAVVIVEGYTCPKFY